MDNLKYSIKTRLIKDKVFFGPGVVSLLRLTEKYESVNAAAKNMQLSYSKAYKMIRGTEDAMGFKILDRKIGGANGGGSTLTPECIELLNTYEKFSSELEEISEDLFNKYFSKYLCD
jgi:molybdate transport repressor ModE-like protein